MYANNNKDYIEELSSKDYCIITVLSDCNCFFRCFSLEFVNCQDNFLKYSLQIYY